MGDPRVVAAFGQRSHPGALRRPGAACRPLRAARRSRLPPALRRCRCAGWSRRVRHPPGCRTVERAVVVDVEHVPRSDRPRARRRSRRRRRAHSWCHPPQIEKLLPNFTALPDRAGVVHAAPVDTAVDDVGNTSSIPSGRLIASECACESPTIAIAPTWPAARRRGRRPRCPPRRPAPRQAVTPRDRRVVGRRSVGIRAGSVGGRVEFEHHLVTAFEPVERRRRSHRTAARTPTSITPPAIGQYVIDARSLHHRPMIPVEPASPGTGTRPRPR